MTNLRKHHSLYSWFGSNVCVTLQVVSGSVTWAHWVLGELAGPGLPTLV